MIFKAGLGESMGEAGVPRGQGRSSNVISKAGLRDPKGKAADQGVGVEIIFDL